MKRSGNGPSVGWWPFASIAFQPARGVGWRLHMSKIALQIQIRQSYPNTRDHAAKAREVIV